MAPKVKLKPPFMGQHLTLSGWFRDGFSRIFSNFMILLFSKSLSSLFSGTRLVTLVMQWPGTRRRLVGKRATADIWRQNFSSCIFSSNAKELELISRSCRMGGVSGPQLAKADVFSLGLSVYEAARLRRSFVKHCEVLTPVSTTHSQLMSSLGKWKSVIYNIYAQVAQECWRRSRLPLHPQGSPFHSAWTS